MKQLVLIIMWAVVNFSVCYADEIRLEELKIPAPLVGVSIRVEEEIMTSKSFPIQSDVPRTFVLEFNQKLDYFCKKILFEEASGYEKEPISHFNFKSDNPEKAFADLVEKLKDWQMKNERISEAIVESQPITIKHYLGIPGFGIKVGEDKVISVSVVIY